MSNRFHVVMPDGRKLAGYSFTPGELYPLPVFGEPPYAWSSRVRAEYIARCVGGRVEVPS